MAQNMWCVPRIDAEFVGRMEDVLDLYAETPDPSASGHLLRRDPSNSSARCARRCPPSRGSSNPSTANIGETARQSLRLPPSHPPWLNVKVTEHRTRDDFAQCMRDLGDVHYPEAERIRVVMDNLSAHSAATCTKPSRLRRPDEFSAASSFTIPRNMPAG